MEEDTQQAPSETGEETETAETPETPETQPTPTKIADDVFDTDDEGEFIRDHDVMELAAKAAAGEVDFDADGNVVARAPATEESEQETTSDEPEQRSETQPDEEESAEEKEVPKEDTRLGKGAEELAQQAAQLRQLTQRLDAREKALEERERQAEERRKDPLQVVADAMGIKDPLAAYEALSREIIAGKHKPDDPQTVLQKQIQSLTEKVQTFEEEKKKTAFDNQVSQLRTGLHKMVKDAPESYPALHAIGVEDMAEVVLDRILSQYDQDGTVLPAGPLLQQLESRSREKLKTAMAHQGLLSALGMSNEPSKKQTPSAGTGEKAKPKGAPETLTNTNTSTPAPKEEDDSWMYDDDEVERRAAAELAKSLRRE